MANPSLTIQSWTAEEHGFADSLREAEGWNQTLADLQRLIEHQPDGCFIAHWNGQPAATVTTTIHGTGLAWIGMMLVHPEFRRRGIASALIEHCLRFLESRTVRCIKLDATPAGQPVYEQLGFKPEWDFQRWERPSSVPSLNPHLSNGLINRHHNPIIEIPDWDVNAFGADRQSWLKRLALGSHVSLREGGLGMLRPGSRADYLGPVIAQQANTANEIIEELLSTSNGRCYWDVPGPNQTAISIALRLGFQPVRQLLRMWTGTALVTGDVTKQFAMADPATG